MRPRIVLFDSNVDYIGAPLALLSITTLLDTTKYEIHIVTQRDYPDYEKRILDLCRDALCLGITCITGRPIGHALRVRPDHLPRDAHRRRTTRLALFDGPVQHLQAAGGLLGGRGGRRSARRTGGQHG